MGSPRKMPKAPTVDEALMLKDEHDSATCRTCTAPSEGESVYCWACEGYWADVDAGLWDYDLQREGA